MARVIGINKRPPAELMRSGPAYIPTVAALLQSYIIIQSHLSFGMRARGVHFIAAEFVIAIASRMIPYAILTQFSLLGVARLRIRIFFVQLAAMILHFLYMPKIMIYLYERNILALPSVLQHTQ